MGRIYLKFEREAKVKETGVVAVSTDGSTSIADVYKQAFKKDFKEWLTSDREYEDEKWEFSIIEGEDKSA